MQRVKGTRAHLAGHEEVSQVRPRVVPAGIAAALRIEGTVVLGVPGVPDIETSLAGEELAVPGVARRQHAVEHVDAARDALDQVLGRARAHEIPRPIRRQPLRRRGGHRIHLIDRLTDAEAADGVALEPDRGRGVGALVAEVLEDSALNNAELGLTPVGDVHAIHGT
jgi:hypothetical protein